MAGNFPAHDGPGSYDQPKYNDVLFQSMYAKNAKNATEFFDCTASRQI